MGEERRGGSAPARDGRSLRRRFFKVAFFSLMSLLAVVIAAGGLVFWRVNQGPISLTFMKPRIEAEMNKKLGGMSISLTDVILERDRKSGIPSLRLRNIELRDAAGSIIARAPPSPLTSMSSCPAAWCRAASISSVPGCW